jgi:Flp pilus assembly protein TadD
LFDLLFKPLPAPEVRRKQYFQTQGVWLLSRGNKLDARSFAARLQAENPTDPGLRGLLATAQLCSGDYSAARDFILATITEHAKDDAALALLANNLAWVDVMIDKPELLDEADRVSAQAYALTPWAASVQSTRGLVLVERGESETGIALLKSALRGVDMAPERVLVLCSLAIAHYRSGELAVAQRLLSRARGQDPNCEMLARVERLARHDLVMSGSGST